MYFFFNLIVWKPKIKFMFGGGGTLLWHSRTCNEQRVNWLPGITWPRLCACGQLLDAPHKVICIRPSYSQILRRSAWIIFWIYIYIDFIYVNLSFKQNKIVVFFLLVSNNLMEMWCYIPLEKCYYSSLWRVSEPQRRGNKSLILLPMHVSLWFSRFFFLLHFFIAPIVRWEKLYYVSQVVLLFFVYLKKKLHSKYAKVALSNFIRETLEARTIISRDALQNTLCPSARERNFCQESLSERG